MREYLESERYYPSAGFNYMLDSDTILTANQFRFRCTVILAHSFTLLHFNVVSIFKIVDYNLDLGKRMLKTSWLP